MPKSFHYPSAGPVRSRIRRPRWHPSTRADLVWGAFFGLSLATGFALWVIGLAVLQGSPFFSQVGVSLWRLLGFYYGMGLALGLLSGTLRPLTRQRWGAALVGTTIATLAYGGAGILLLGWSSPRVLLALVPGILLGGGLGLVFFDEARERSQTPQAKKGRLVAFFAALLVVLALFAVHRWG